MTDVSGWLLVGWVLINGILFASLFGYAWSLRRRWHSSPVGYIATALVLVAGTFLVSSIQRLGIHAARVELLPSDWEDFFLSGFQVVLSLVGTVTGVYAVTRVRAGLQRIEEAERMVSVLTEGAPLDVSVSDWGLTARELQVLETIVAGRTSDEQIAETLFIAASTAATHVRNILRKAGLSNRMDLMLVGTRSSDRQGRKSPRRPFTGPDLPGSG
ncbi:MAG TPA: LuxR C-terminal-related transcriptional regulator [Acidimicrobiia bacterium]|nr:LuxR C-terminal-related transcriptional regulator [Acidimicrobiia bacterium]